MRLATGTLLGPYEVAGPLGAGGMGEVYKAVDTRLNRTVALKILPAHLSGHPDVQARFEREARTIAGLSHPNICTLHDIGSDVVSGADGTAAGPGGPDAAPVSYLVLEYLEGETLADRLARGPLPLSEAIRIGIDVADALDKAHRQHIVHRDLKPANVMLTRSGPKLLDFGLARWIAGEADALAAMPTRADITGQGMMLGTLQYMAPEQIEGEPADARTDIFAFGTLLYEMVTGRKAFQGKSQATLIAAIMNRDPLPISEIVPISPPALEHLVERCLAKAPDDRWQTTHALALQLRWMAYGADGSAVPAAAAADPVRERRVWIAAAAAALVAALLAVPALLHVTGGGEPEPAFSYRVPVRGLSQSDVAISPDGTTVVFTASPSSGDPAALYVRPVRGLSSRRLAGTEDATQPFWSPDSRSIGFVAGGALKRVDVADGRVQTIAPAADARGGTWSRDGTILFGSPAGLFRVSAEGGAPQAVTTVEAPETGHYFPRFLPDGDRYLYSTWSADAEGRAVYAAALGTGDRTRIVAAASDAAYASRAESRGYLFFRREDALFAQPFDAGSLSLTAEPLRVAGGVAYSADTGRSAFDVSPAGVLIYVEGTSAGAGSRAGSISPTFALGFVDRAGTIEERAIEPGPYGDFDLSPDGRKIAITRVEPGMTADIWIVDLDRGVPDRLTLDPSDDFNPVWSHDGTRVAFTTWRNGNADVYVKNANGVGPEESLLDSPRHEQIEAWSRDGQYIAYELGQDALRDLHVKRIPDGEAFPVVEGRFQKGEPQFSPDGRWLAYITDESGRFEVYVMSFPDGRERRRISTDGGGQPRWSSDSRTLYFRAPTPPRQVMAVDIGDGPALTVTPPRQLFIVPQGGTASEDPQRHMWAVAPGGRFLVRIPPGVAGGAASAGVPAVIPTEQGTLAATARRPTFAPVSEGLTVVLDWPSALVMGARR